MSYAAASNVAEYCPNLVGGEDNFTANTKPTKTAVERWLSSGCAVIEGRLKAAGYSTPVSSTATIYDQIVDLETMYGVARAEMTRLSPRTVPGERSRSQIFMDIFNQELDRLMKMDLSSAGVTHTGAMYAGGVSESDKSTVEADTDRVIPRFKRGQFRVPGTTRPSSSGDDETT